MVTEDDGSKTVTSKVPNALLEVNEPITVYVFFVNSNSVGETVYEINIPVYPKAKPDDYKYVKNIEKLELSVIEAHIGTLVEEETDNITIYNLSNENAITIKRIEVR